MSTGALGHPTPASAPWPLPPGMKTLRVNDYDMAYIERGAGMPVILLHGSHGDYRSFALQMEPLGRNYRAIAASLRHYYPEPWDGKGEFSSRQHVADVIAFIEALGAGRAHLLGHSRGGHVAMHVARLRPDLIRSLILAEPGLPPAALMGESAEGQRLAAARVERTKKTMELVRAGKIAEAAEFFVDGISGKGTYQARSDAANQITRENIRTALGEARDTREPITCEEAGKIEVPTLLIGGEMSKPHFGLVLDALQRCMKNVKRVSIPGAAHTMNRGNPEAFNEAVLSFITNYWRAPPPKT